MGNKSNLERFMEGFEKLDSGCWKWKRGKLGKGYGAFWMNGRLRGAHRASMALFKQYDLEEKSMILHSCDNTWCVNPDHLRPGDAVENAADMMSRGRGKWVPAPGESNPNATITNKQKEIIISMVRNKKNRKEISMEFGITTARVHQIAREAGIVIQKSPKERAAQTHCLRGHAYSEFGRHNKNGSRICKECMKMHSKNYLAKKLPKNN